MMKYLLVVVITFSLALGLHAQPKGDLKGPAAKNYKPWKSKKNNVKVITTIYSKKRMMGPAAKNQKPGKDVNASFVIATAQKKVKLKGPVAKNRKPWSRTKK